MESNEQEMNLISSTSQPESTTKTKAKKFANKKCLKLVLFLLILCYFGLIALFYQNSTQVKNVEKKNLELENKIQDYLKEISNLQEQNKEKKNNEENIKENKNTNINENINNNNKNNIPSLNFIDKKSSILNSHDFSLLNDWIFPGGQIGFNLLFSSESNKISPQSFHSKFDSNLITNSLIIIKLTDGQIIGGFTYNNWKPKEYKTDRYAFLFNLNNKKRYYVKDRNRAIFTDDESVVVFGDGDIIIKNEKDAYSLFPLSYGDKIDNTKNELTNGKKFFEIEKMEGYVLEEIDLGFYD